ncbi:hypothetical protein H8A08_09895, partial [Neisseria meningitidis]|nr:hypothetical protein [Neisseria meningitidis]
NAYVNTAHGTRGLATAPICAAAVAAEILGLPHPSQNACGSRLVFRSKNRYV